MPSYCNENYVAIIKKNGNLQGRTEQLCRLQFIGTKKWRKCNFCVYVENYTNAVCIINYV